MLKQIINWIFAPAFKGVLGSIVSGIFGSSDNKRTLRSNARQAELDRQWNAEQSELAHERALERTILGNDLDMENQKEMFDYRINQGKEAGLTPYEMFMGPAGGAGGGTTGSGSVLGNQPGQLAAAQMQARAQAASNRTELLAAQMQNRTQLAQSAISAAAQLGTAKIQSGANIESSNISADASKYKTDLDFLMNSRKLALTRERFNRIDLPQAAANIGKTYQETKELINRVATSDPEFMVMMKRLQMGPQNVLVEYAINNFGFNPLDKESVQNASNEKKRNFLGLVLGSQSVAVREAFGTSMGLGMGYGQAKDTLGNMFRDLKDKYGFGFD
jgi:hypothetical protein